MSHPSRSCALRPARLALVFALGAGRAAAGAAEPADLRVPANPLLVRHSNFFTPTVYELHSDPYSRPFVPAGLSYRVFQAVGYDIAASMLIVGPDGGLS